MGSNEPSDVVHIDIPHRLVDHQVHTLLNFVQELAGNANAQQHAAAEQQNRVESGKASEQRLGVQQWTKRLLI